MTLSHANVTAEHGFSVNTALLSKVPTIQALRVVKEAIWLYGSNNAVPVTRQMTDSMKKMFSQYLNYLDTERKEVDAQALQQKVA